MSERKLPRPSGDVVDDGVPATEEVRDEVLRTGDAGVADMPVPDRPLGADDWGITDLAEERRTARRMSSVQRRTFRRYSAWPPGT